MRTLGDSMGKFLSLLIFKIILVSFIIFTAGKLVVRTLVENISGVSQNQKENLEKLNQSPIGKYIMEVVPNSKSMLNFGEKSPWTELYLASIEQKENVTTKKPDNYS
jgi:hypothetical protein